MTVKGHEKGHGRGRSWRVFYFLPFPSPGFSLRNFSHRAFTAARAWSLRFLVPAGLALPPLAPMLAMYSLTGFGYVFVANAAWLYSAGGCSAKRGLLSDLLARESCRRLGFVSG